MATSATNGPKMTPHKPIFHVRKSVAAKTPIPLQRLSLKKGTWLQETETSKAHEEEVGRNIQKIDTKVATRQKTRRDSFPRQQLVTDPHRGRGQEHEGENG